MKFGERIGPDELKRLTASIPNGKRERFISKHPKLTNLELIKHMRDKGITFDVMTDKLALEKLNDSNYYFKLGAYRLNYEKNEQQKYIDLDFAYLDDLASLDMRFRYIIMQVSLDLEHTLKTKILSSIGDNEAEDGYEIVKQFEVSKNVDTHDILTKHNTPFYLDRIQRKYVEDSSIWVLMELMTMGNLSKFIEFYYEYTSFKKKKWKEASLLFRYAKNIRNAAAHSNPILIDLYGKRKYLDSEGKTKNVKLDQIIVNRNSLMKIDKEVYQNPKVNDFLCLMYLHNQYANKGSKLNKIALLEDFSKQCTIHKEYYEKNEKLLVLYESLNKIIDYYKNN
ncbi:MAG: Abi family protein [Carnobacterium sp.]|nr:Abi family protein [Carnobacterium sp.]